jgi:hypothetical protein
MSDNIDIPVTASGDDDVNRVTSAVDRLTAAMERLGSNSALDRLAEQMQLMQATMVTGFANLAATSDKMLQALAGRQVAAIEAGAEKATAAIEAAGLRMKAADARTWEQFGRGSAANVTAAFYQLAKDIPVEAVEARFGQMATSMAQGLDGQLAKLRQFQENAKSLYLTDYKPMAGATKADNIIDLAKEEELAVRWERMLEEQRDKVLAGEALFDATVAKMGAERVAQRALDLAREEEIAVRWERMLEEQRDKVLAGEALFNATVAKLDAERVGQRALDAAREEEIAARWETMLQAQRDKELEGEAVFNRAVAKLQADRLAAAEAAAERQRTLNTNYLTASPAAQVRTATQAQTYAQLGGDAAARYGSAAAGADALAAAEARLATSSRGAAAAQLEMDGVLRQVEGAFRGAAHEAGIYGLHHGQLIALLAGGAVAAGLHHIAETGAEVEFQLASLNALAGSMTKVDLNQFVAITSGTMTSLTDAAEGVHALAQAGLDQKAAYAALPDVMRLASLGEMTVAQSAEMAVESMHAFGKSITDLGAIGDILVAVGSKANVSVHTLAEDMKSAAVTGAMFNLNMEEITATVGALAERGLTIQPLSSALMKLYEPSDKTAKAMQALGLSTKDASGNLKTYTVFMEELAEKVAQFKVPADIFKQLGMSSRDSKAIEVMTQDFEGYKHLLHEAQDAHGKMFDAMTAKEDTVEGTWKRLGSTVQGSLVTAFDNASPALQHLEEELLRVTGVGSDFQKSLSAIVAGFARLAETVVTGIGPLAALAGAYVALRVISSAATWTAEFAAAQRLQAEASLAGAAALRTESTQLELFAAAENAAAAGGARLALTTTEVAAGARLLASAFGWISLAVVGVTTAIDLMGGAMTENEREHLKQQNTYDTTSDAITREIERLKGLEDQLRKTGETGTAAAAAVMLSFAQMEEGNAKADLEKAKLAAPKITATTGMSMVGGLAPTVSADVTVRQAALDKAQIAYDTAHARTVSAMNKLAELDTREEEVASLTQVAKLKKEIEKLPSHVEPIAKTDAAREAAKAANEGLAALRQQEVLESNVIDLAKVYEKVQKDISATKLDATKAALGDKDAARAVIEQLQEQLRLAQMLSKSRLEDAKSENKRGELGDLQLINTTLAENLALHQRAVDIAKQELAAAGPLKPGQQEKYNSRIQTAKQQLVDDQATAARAIADLFDKMDTQELQARAKALESKGRLEDAYNLTWQAKNANLMANLASDIADAENAQYRDRLVRFQRFMEDQRRLGANDARFKEGKEQFGSAASALDLRLSTIQQQTSGPGSSLGDQLQGLDAQRSAYAELIPAMQAAQARVAAASSSLFGGDDSKLKEAQNELKAIQDRMAAMRNIGVSMADAIGKALSDAFGQGGAALAGMISATMAYDARVQAIKQKQASDGDGAAAAQAMASAQVKAYGDMAGAAKGFFDTNSKGYKILQTTEQAFRAIELADAAAVMAKKILFKSAEVSAVVAGDGAKMTSGTAATAVDLVNAGASATAWGIAAVARAIESLPFPANLAAGAATAAALVALGVKMTSGGGGQTEAQKQQQNATGTVLGDPDAKSESVSKSLDLVEKNTYNNLVVAQGMLSSLRSIESNIKGFVSQLFKAGAVDGSAFSASNSGLYGALKSGSATGAGSLLGAGAGYAAGAGLSAFTALASIGGPIGMVIGALAGRYFGSALASIFGGKQTIDASGFTMSSSTLGQVASGGANAMSYADITTSGGWFRGNSHDTKTQSLGADANLQITRVITGMGDAITAAAGLLGESGADFKDKLNGFVIDIGKIDLKGLSSADAQAKVAAVFSKLGDQMAQAAFGGLEQFQQAGEGYLETLTRVANDYATIDTVFKSFGTTYAEVGTASIAAREELINMAGGLDKFTSQASWFFQNMLTKAQQTAATSAAINPTLAKYGLSTQGADAVQKFTDLTIAMGAMGSAGATAYTELMSIAQAFKSVTDVTKSLQDQIDELTLSQAEKDAAARAQLDPSNQGLYDELVKAKAVAQAKQELLSAYQSESSAIQSTIDRLKSLSQSLRNFVNGLQIGNMSPLNPADQYGAARSQFEATLAKAKSGDIAAQGNLQTAAQAFLTASKAANASNSTYQSDYQRVVATVTSMADKADSQVTTAQTSLALLNQQVSQLIKIDTSVTTVVDAINNLAVVLSNGKDTGTNTVSLTSLYQSLLGRAPDQAGLDYWNKQLQSGVSLSDIIAAMKNSSEYVNHSTTTTPTTVVTPSTNTGTALGNVNPTSNSSAISALYQSLLGRSPDQAGLDYWVKQMQSGTTLASITAAIKSSSEYQSHAGTGTMSSTSASVAPAVPVTKDTYASSTAQTAAIVAQLTTLNKQVTELRTEQQTQADHQTSATMTAAANNSAKVADAVTIASQKASWSAKSAVALR